ncbi:hypothetical protein DdX_18916 [Ditylenchus destructor]|uniref:Uncharacterized protein n=1 Tax=Ditylenchus destructor TaxID=166010 RepID=A0AAD4QXP9_9BILA|nr:hypothetical protein DdX_18916 [Ditylenchus destructor]
MRIGTAALVALLVLYLCWTDETLAAKRSSKHKGQSRAATPSHRHSAKNGQNKITKKNYWRQIGDLNRKLAKEIQKKGKNGISRKWKKKWRKAKKNLDKQYKARFGKAPSKKEKKKYEKKKSGKSENKRKKVGKGLNKRKETGKEHSVRKASEENRIVQSEIREKSGGPELGHPSTPPSNHTPPSTHHSNHHHNATQQQTPASQTTGDTAQPSTSQNQQSNEPKKEAKRSQYDDPTSDEKWQKMGIKEQLDYLTKQGFK